TSVFLDLGPAAFEISVQITSKVFIDDGGEISRIPRFAYESGFAFNNFLLKAAHVSDNSGQPKAVSKKNNPALKYIDVRKHKNVGGFEVQFRLIVRHILDSFGDTLPQAVAKN